MAKLKSMTDMHASDSDSDLPTLDELLGGPRPALAPTSLNTASKSPAKSNANRQSPRKKETIHQASHERSASASFEHADLAKPALPPATARQSPAKRTAMRSPRKTSQEAQKPKSVSEASIRRQRALKSPVKDPGLLLKPLKVSFAENSSTPPRQKRTIVKKTQRRQQPLAFSTDSESEETREVSQEFDIFKGSGIHRKTPRRIAKKRAAYKEEESLLSDTFGEDDKNTEKDDSSIWSAGTRPVASELEDDDLPAARRRRAEEDDRLSLKLSALRLVKPRSNIDPTGSPRVKKSSSSPSKDRDTIRVPKGPNETTRPSSVHSTNSVSHGTGAVLRFSPPSSPSLSRLPPQPTTPASCTPPPPASPGKLKSPSKLKSPTKLNSPPKLQSTRPAAARPSLDAFWAQDVVNDYHDMVSPIKPPTSPRKKHLQDFFADRSDDESTLISETPSPTSSPRKKGAGMRGKNDPEAAARKAEKDRLKAFNNEKEKLAYDFVKQLDDRITNGEISRLTASTGGVQIIWSKKLNSTAGRANWRRERRLPSSTPSTLSTSTSTSTNTNTNITTLRKEPTYKHIATIDLASKVVTTTERLYNVLAHEFCHLANFMLSRELKAPHGPSFQSWARKTTTVFGESHAVEVTTRHEYEIGYKYVWRCVVGGGVDAGDGEGDGCGQEYKRHSKSIDTTRHTCGKCRGSLVQILPKPRAGASPVKKSEAMTGVTVVKGAGEYSKFVKERFKAVKEAMPPGSPSKDVMREIAVRYRERKERMKEGAEVEVVEVGDDGEDSGHGEGGQGSGDGVDSGVGDVARRLEFVRL